MTWPNPPTDNIYKFCALTGTIIFLLSLYIPLKARYDIFEKLEAVELKTKISEIERQYWKDKATTLETITKNAMAEQNGIKFVDKNKLAIRYTESEVKQMTNDLAESLRNIEIKDAEAGSAMAEVKRLNSAANLLFYLSFLTIITGLSLGIYGYLSWYFKIQKYEDKRIEEPVTKKGRRLTSRSSGGREA
jgi:hypothetical protein